MPAANVTVIDKVAAHAGALKGVVLDYVGPSSYLEVSGTGETLSAQQIMLKNIFFVSVGFSDDNLNIVYPIIVGNKAVSSVELMWVVRTTGAEVAAAVDLDGKRVRLMVWGN